jgi:hypothetical protein
MKPIIAIFSGKQKAYNVKILTLLYDNGPQTDWKMTEYFPKCNRISLHATLNKRLRALEKKGYLRRIDKKWYFSIKGLIAVLLILPEPRIWNSKWTEPFEAKAKKIEEQAAPLLTRYGLEKKDIRSMLSRMGFLLNDFDTWVDFSKRVNGLMEKGIINFDLIRESTLLGVIIMEGMSAEEIADLTNPKPQ